MTPPKHSLIISALVLYAGILSAQGPDPVQTRLYENHRLFDRGNPVVFNPEWGPFFHGVASGDPLEDRVVIWTRVTPESGAGEPVEVSWKVALDAQLQEVVSSGEALADTSKDYTVKVDVAGLSAGTTYYYGFYALGKNSLTGKTKTTPGGNNPDHLKFGVVSCSNFQAGFFNAYGRLAERKDLDAVIHLGDYIYEYPNGVYGNPDLFEERPVEPETEILSLAEYRTRYSTYHLDTNLIRVHQQHPFIAVWDDHEAANNSYADGAQNHDTLTEGPWADRKAAAKKAYFEWMPIRDDAEEQVYRTIQYGEVLDLILLDTRLEGRNKQLDDATDPALFDPNRTILGPEQKAWLLGQLSASTAKWKVLGQQVLFGELNVGWAALQDSSATYYEVESFFLDIWDGYPAERQQLIDFVQDNQIDNVVVLTGDIHSAFALDVPKQAVNLTFDQGLPYYGPTDYNPATGANSAMVEFVTPSITSPNFDENIGLLQASVFQLQLNNPILISGGNSLGNPNPHIKYADLIQHGYYILDIKPDSVQANYYYSPIATPSEQEQFQKAWYALDGENHLRAAGAPSGPKAVQDIPAPSDPPLTGTREEKPSVLAVLGVYPNPFSGQVTLHYSLRESGDMLIRLLDANGRAVQDLMQEKLPAGTYSLELDGKSLIPGLYLCEIRVDGKTMTIPLIKAD
ncbi:MAG: alkaline phosphatase D family protein [Saprospirales bacterium]|nr:alkaline phosphatase D family protein [Saprospirales bacterium]